MVLSQARKVLETVAPVSNGAEREISFGAPYTVRVTIEGVADLLFHAWNNESVEGKSNAAKGSKAKKTDDTESYVYRDDKGHICLPGEYLRMSIVTAAKFKQDPRSPRKSAMDLYKAGIVVTPPLASLGSKDWDYLDRRRVMVQRNAITRARPAFKQGWRASFEITVIVPEYIDSATLYEVVAMAGRLSGVGDFRPTYGRFGLVKWEVID
jgi:hypothetical protein